MKHYAMIRDGIFVGFGCNELIPIHSDDIELTEQEHKEALKALGQSKEPYIENNVLLFKKIKNAVKEKELAAVAIDNTAGQARARFATDSPFIEPEYELSYKEAVVFIETGYQGECPETVKAHAEAYSVSDQVAADKIKLMGDQWYNVIRAVRKIRLAGKQAVETATDDADFMAVSQPFIDQLNALQP